jgi:AbrB family looped-hinge helix DNA binding protein
MEFKTQITKNGKLVLPAKFRKALQIEAGDEIMLRLEDGSIRLFPLRQAVGMAQKIVRQYIPSNTCMVDKLIQARRLESKHE